MPLELYIEGEKVFLSEETQIGFTFQINDIAELKDRQSNFSTQFDVPYNDNNNRILGYANNINSASTVPYSRKNVRITDTFSGANVIENGILFVEQSQKAFQVQIYSGLVDFFDLIADKGLQDIYFDPMSYPTFSLIGLAAAYENMQNDVPENYFSYLVDNGLLPAGSRIVGARDLRFSVFLNYLFKRIHNDAGYTYNENYTLFQNYIFKDLFLPFVNEKIEHLNIVKPSTFLAYLVSNFDIGSDGLYIPQIPPYETLSSGTYNNNGSFVAPYLIYIQRTGQAKISYSGVVVLQNAFFGSKIRVKIRKNGDNSQIAFEKTYYDGDFGDVLGVFCLKNNSASVILSVTIGDYYEVIYEAIPDLSPGEPLPAFTLLRDDFITGGKSFISLDYDDGDDPWNNKWILEKNLPALKQKDLIKGICQMFGLIALPNAADKTIRYITFEDIVKNKAIARDWSKYLTEDIKFINTYFHPDYAQRNNLNYKHDEQVDDKIGNGEIDISDESLPPTNDELFLPWAASEPANKLLTTFLTEILTKIVTGFDLLNQPIYDDVTPEPRILLRSLVNVSNIHYADPDTATQFIKQQLSTGYFNVIGAGEGLGFSKTLLRDYYTGLSSTFNQYRKIVPRMRIPAREIAALDQTIPIYLKQLNSYFYINKIINWESDKDCTAELIRI